MMIDHARKALLAIRFFSFLKRENTNGSLGIDSITRRKKRMRDLMLVGPPSVGKTMVNGSIFSKGGMTSGNIHAGSGVSEKEKEWLNQESGSVFLTYRTGYRTWSIRKDGDSFALYSNYSNYFLAWPKREEFMAECLNGGSRYTVPYPTCSCGIYAFNDMADIKNSVKDIKRSTFLGKVKLWGKVLEYTEGVKAQFAYPLCITEARCDVCGVYEKLEKLSYYYARFDSTFPISAFCSEHDRDYNRDPTFDFEKLDPSFLHQIAKDYGIAID